MAAFTQRLKENPRTLLGCVVEDRKLVGTFAEEDLLHRVTLKGKDPATTTVGEVITMDMVTVDVSEPIGAVISRMVHEGMLAVPLLQDGDFYGVFSIFDAAEHNQHVLGLIGEQLPKLSPEDLEKVSQLKVKLWSYVRNISRNQRLLKLRGKD